VVEQIPTSEITTDWLRSRIKDFGDRTCFICNEQTVTYGEVESKTAAVAALLDECGVACGDVVVLRAEFGVESLAAMIALMVRAAVVVPVADSVPYDQFQQRVSESNATWIWDLSKSSTPGKTQQSNAPHQLISQLSQKERAGLVLFSSGSAGRPKAMIHDLSNLVNSYQTRKPRRLRILSFLLFDHIGGFNTLFSAIASGMTLIVPDSREAESIAQLIETHAIQILPTSPTFLNLLLMCGSTKKYDLSSLKIITYGTEPMPTGLLERLTASFPKTRFVQTFGTSETGITKTQSKSSSSNLLKLNDPDMEHKIVDGELWLRSKTQILGYLNHTSDRFTEDGWFKTGDLVEVADEEFIKVVGRLSEIINVGGEKVTPAEVEGILMQLDEVLDCRVYGVESSITGQSVAAEIVLKSGSEQSSLKRTIRKHCAGKCEPYKIPSKIKIVDSTQVSSRFKKSRVGIDA
jgi:acyl-coenzyme A synthetase/AMP-(fatty) acid ligase